MRQKVIEHIKTAVIVLLLCSAAVLAFAANFPQTLQQLRDSLSTSGAATPPTAERGEFAVAAKPIAISIRSETGRQTIARDFSQLDSTYEAFAGYLGEALATAEPPQRLSTSALPALSQLEGLYFCYAGAIPLDALAQWLESEYDDATLNASWFFLAVDSKETVTLYFGTETATYRCATQLVSAALLEQISTIRPDGSYFAGESQTASLSRVNPRSLLLSEQSNQAAAAAAASAVTEDLCTQIASKLQFNPYGDGAYRTTDGTVVYTESLCSLRITPEGQLSLVNQDASRYSARSASNSDLITTAYTAIASLTDLFTSDARIYLTGVFQQDNQITLYFDYLLDGLVIAQQQGHDASVTFTDGTISTMILWLRTYTRQDTTMTVLPAPQAAALLYSGALLQLEYADLGDGTLQLGWKA